MKLDFTFIAEYHNGQIYKQTPEDRSVKEPTTRSAFYDVEQEKVKRFSLTGKGHIITVDLTDGHFEVDGNKIYTNPPPIKLNLLYSQRVLQTIGELSEKRRYYIGWQTKYKGKEVKSEMGID